MIALSPSPLVVRPASSVDAPDLRRLAALDSAKPLTGEILLAYAGGDLRAALSLQTGRTIADPFYPSANLVDVLRTAAGTPSGGGARRRALGVRRPALA
jgi:hypothetical protein